MVVQQKMNFGPVDKSAQARKMRLQDWQMTFTENVAKLIIFANSVGVRMTFGEAFRPQFVDDIYVEKKLSQTHHSNHTRRLAVDFNFFIKDNIVYDSPVLRQIGDFWTSRHLYNRWGGNYKTLIDRAHFEMNVPL